MPDLTATVCVDDHQFVVASLGGGLFAGQLATSDLLLVHEDGADDVSVITGAQYGDVQVTAVVTDVEPGPPADDWEDVVELSVRCGSGLAVAPPMDATALTIVNMGGDYRLRVSARGRDRGAAQEQRTSGDGNPLGRPTIVEHYRLEIWPAPLLDPAVVRLTSGLARTVREGPAVEPSTPGEQRGVTGARAIGAALDRFPAERPSTDLGGLRVAATLTGPRRNVFPFMTVTCGTFDSYTHLGRAELRVGAETWVTSHRTIDEGGDRLTGSSALVRLTIQQLVRPRSATVAWNWFTPIAPENRRPVLPDDSLVHLTFAEQQTESGATTPVEVVHSGLPVEWVEPMTNWWTWRLERAEQRQMGTF